MFHRFVLAVMTVTTITLWVLTSGCTSGQSQASARRLEATRPVQLILDTDIGTDVDDAGALAMLHAMASRGEAHILAVMSCNRNRWSGPAIDVINTYYHRPGIPIGATRTGPDAENWYHEAVPGFPHRLSTTSEAPDAISLYRQILAAQPNDSVTIVTIGWLTNMANLLNSRPDACSPLTGSQLVAAKVKELVAMGGIWPNSKNEGDYNFNMDRSAARTLIESWPGPIMFTGLGRDVMTGSRLMSEGPADNPVRTFYDAFLTANKVTARSSWDLIAVLYAVRGLSEYFTADTNGRCVVSENGRFRWMPGPGTDRQGYLIYKMPPAQLASVLEDLMLSPPDAAASQG